MLLTPNWIVEHPLQPLPLVADARLEITELEDQERQVSRSKHLILSQALLITTQRFHFSSLWRLRKHVLLSRLRTV
jgi:hypothetical protein